MGQRGGRSNDKAGGEQAELEATGRRTGDTVSTSKGMRAGKGELLTASPKRGMRAQKTVVISTP